MTSSIKLHSRDCGNKGQPRLARLALKTSILPFQVVDGAIVRGSFFEFGVIKSSRLGIGISILKISGFGDHIAISG